jgi:fusion and transport protein UGO1
MARSFVASSFQGFLSTALIMPFEVGKTLAQVQWVPRDGIDPMTWGGNQDVVEEEVVEVGIHSFVDGPSGVLRAVVGHGGVESGIDGGLDGGIEARGSCAELEMGKGVQVGLFVLTPNPTPQLDDEAEAEAYFSDLQARGQTSFAPPTDAPLRPVSPSGYLMRSGISDVGLGTKPEWIMPVVVQGGVWEMMKTVGKWKGEGWSSLWKGTLCSHLDVAVSRHVLYH